MLFCEWALFRETTVYKIQFHRALFYLTGDSEDILAHRACLSCGHKSTYLQSSSIPPPILHTPLGGDLAGPVMLPTIFFILPSSNI